MPRRPFAEPLMLAFEIIARRRIDEAIANGEFDGLELRGVPVDLGDYFNLPADLRAAWSILRNARCVPREVELLREIESLREKVRHSDDEAERSRLGRLLQEREISLRMMLERSARARRTS